MRELFIFVNNEQARMAGFKQCAEGFKHPQLPEAFVYNPAIHRPENLHGLRFDRVYVDSAVARAFRRDWTETRARIGGIVRCPDMIWIEPS